MFKPKNPRITCADGFNMSVQASVSNYSTPRNDAGPYTEVEVGFPNKVEPLLIPFQDSPGYTAPINDVYGWVPIDIILDVIEAHGGLVTGKLPYNRNRRSLVLAAKVTRSAQ